MTADAVARVFIAFGQGLMVQMTWGQRFNIADCVDVIRSLVVGAFLVHDATRAYAPRPTQDPPTSP